MVPVIFDNDAGSDIDDLWALGMVLAHPELDLLAVTTVSNDTQLRARLNAKMLRLWGRPDIPVYAGARAPKKFVADGNDPKDFKNNLSHGDLIHEEDEEYIRAYPDAVPFMLDALTKAKEPIGIIATGPWTNVAEVIEQANEDQLANIRFLSLMGGEVFVMHNEANVKNDPEAADVIFRSGLPLFVGTWYVTRQLFFTMEEVEEYLGSSDDPFCKALYEGTLMWGKKALGFKPGPVLYDVIPVFQAAGLDARISNAKVDSLAVELEGNVSRGITYVGRGPNHHIYAKAMEDISPCAIEDAGGKILVSQEIDAEALKAEFIERVFKRKGA